MSHLDPSRPASTSELRKFGLLVGGAFLALAGLLFWRQKATAVVTPFAIIGALLVVLGLAAPRLLALVYKGWMRFAVALSKITTPIFMGVIYFVILTPIGALMRLFGRNPLRRDQGGTDWVTRPATARGSALDRQF
jgi:hypothetical protein